MELENLLCRIDIIDASEEEEHEDESIVVRFHHFTHVLYQLCRHLSSRWEGAGMVRGKISVEGQVWAYRARLDPDYGVWLVEYGDCYESKLWV